MSSSAGGTAAAAAPAPGAEQAAGSDWKKTAIRGLAMYFGFNALSSLGTNYMKHGTVFPPSSNPTSATAGSAGDHVDAASAPAQSSVGVGGALSAFQQPFTAPPLFKVSQDSLSQLIWRPDVPLDFYVFLSSGAAPSHEDIGTQYSPLVSGGAWHPDLNDLVNFDQYPGDALASDGMTANGGEWTIVQPRSVDNEAMPILKLQHVSPKDPRLQASGLAADVTIKTPYEVMHNNGSIWADIVAVKHGEHPLQTAHKARSRKLLTRLFPSRKGREGKRLVGGSKTQEEQPEEDESESSDDDDEAAAAGSSFLSALTGPKKLVTYWHRNLTIALPEQDDSTATPVGRLPPPLLQHMHLVRDENGQAYRPEGSSNLRNYPIMFPNTFWDLRGDMNPINATTPTLDLHIQLYPMAWWKFQMVAALSDSFEKQAGMAGSEVDMIKSTLMNTSPWYLGLMVVVTLLHMLFEFLAFSSDVKHWKSKENFTGVSVGSIFTNIVTQTIILLYLIDSSEQTSWTILGSQCIGVVIEGWKLTKAITVAIKPREPGSKSWLPYHLDVKDKHVLSAEEKETQEYDRLAFKIVAWITAPLLGGYTIYSALYNEHRGWWSFIIGTLCSFVYSFGFVSLVPQIILNYKLKSVAGLNAKTLVYKILTTFVDDIFAFAVPMPTLHRLATLRDDVIFFVYLYQWWVYGVDKTRVNEYGQVADVDAKLAKRSGAEKEVAKEGEESADKVVAETKKDR